MTIARGLELAKTAASKVIPEVGQYPLTALASAYNKAFVTREKVVANKTRFWSGVGAAITTAALAQIPAINTWLASLAESTAGTGVSADVAITAGALLVGAAVGSQVSKQVLRLRNYIKYRKTNLDHVPLSDAQVKRLHHKAEWVDDKAARDVHDFIVKRVEKADKKMKSKHPEIAAAAPASKSSAKLALKAMIHACDNHKGDLTPVISYLKKEIAEAKTQLVTLKEEVDGANRMEIAIPVTSDKPPLEPQHSITTMPTTTAHEKESSQSKLVGLDTKADIHRSRRISHFWTTAYKLHQEENPAAETNSMSEYMRTKLAAREKEIAEMEALANGISTTHSVRRPG